MATLASVSERPSGSVSQVGGALAPPAIPRRRSALAARIADSARRLWWTLVSIGTFTAIWELFWLVGLADPKLKARLADLGATPLAGSPSDFGTLIADETEKWAKVIRAANIKAE